jgi:hypothetical protein
VTTVRRLLGGAGGAATAAVAAYAGPLLPRSAVPGIVAAREALERAVGAARGASDHA